MPGVNRYSWIRRRRGPRHRSMEGGEPVYVRKRLAFAGLVVLLGTFFALLHSAPDISGTACDGVQLWHLVDKERIPALWMCAKAYQNANWWYVTYMFLVTYVCIKAFAIPAGFTFCILGGALYPLPLAQLLTGLGEAIGSSSCYLLSGAFARPVVERFLASKLEVLRSRAVLEREHMLLFNFWLRLTPFLPNWFCNVACPLVGVPLRPFFLASLFGTQGSLLFLSLTGATLRCGRALPCRSPAFAPASAAHPTLQTPSPLPPTPPSFSSADVPDTFPTGTWARTVSSSAAASSAGPLCSVVSWPCYSASRYSSSGPGSAATQPANSTTSRREQLGCPSSEGGREGSVRWPKARRPSVLGEGGGARVKPCRPGGSVLFALLELALLFPSLKEHLASTSQGTFGL